MPNEILSDRVETKAESKQTAGGDFAGLIVQMMKDQQESNYEQKHQVCSTADKTSILPGIVLEDSDTSRDQRLKVQGDLKTQIFDTIMDVTTNKQKSVQKAGDAFDAYIRQ